MCRQRSDVPCRRASSRGWCAPARSPRASSCRPRWSGSRSSTRRSTRSSRSTPSARSRPPTRSAPGDERPFAGVPIAIKNNRAVEGLRLTYGCSLMAEHVADYDHNVTRRLTRRGLRDRRHDDAARVRDPAGQRGAHLRPDAQPVGPRAHARRLLGRRRGGGRRRAWCRSPTATTAAARSASRPPAAGWSG